MEYEIDEMRLGALHLMIDLETLATDARAVVASVGAFQFDPWGDPGAVRADALSDERGGRIDLHLPVEVASQPERTIDAETVRWWFGQDRAVMAAELLGDRRMPADEVARRIAGAFGGIDNLWLWSRGTHFDVAILEDFLRGHGHPTPWRHHRVNDVRSYRRALLAKTAPGRVSDWEVAVSGLRSQLPQHSAREDAALDAYAIALLHHLNGCS